MKKIIMIGIDGSRLDLIDKWANQGRLPNFKKLIDNGTSGILESILPGPHSAPAWTSLVTGKNPGKHGVPYFMLNGEDSYELKLATSYDVKEETLWDYLGKYDYISGVFGVPMTYPPKQIKGVMVCSWGTPLLESEYTFPKDFKNNLKKLKFQLGIDFEKRSQNSLNKLRKLTESHCRAIEWYLNNYSCNFFMNVFIGTEQMHHLYSSFLDNTHPQYNPEFELVMVSYYKQIDDFLGRILLKFEHQANIFIVSDHGHFCAKEEIFLNNVLEKHNFFSRKKESDHRPYENFVILMASIFRAIPESGQNVLKRLIPEKIKNNLRDTKEINADWSKTLCYCPSKIGMLYINLQGREPEGIVPKENYLDTVELIIKTLEQDNEFMEKVNHIYRRDELFKGLFIDKMPDIIIEFKWGYDCNFTSPEGLLYDKINKDHVGVHTKEGVFIAHGPDIKERVKLGKISILDVTPTILYYYGIPVPKSIDGKILDNIFKGTFTQVIDNLTQEKEEIMKSIRFLKIK